MCDRLINMKIAVITTQTTHHAYFVREIAESFELGKVFLETKHADAPFESAHPFEEKVLEYEKESFFNGQNPPVSDFAETVEFSSVNEAEAVEKMKKLSPDVIIVFGAGKIGKELIEVCPEGIINLHGGNPEEYRGLDTHLWSIYHNDFGGLVTTLHRLNPELDDGDIIISGEIPLEKGMELYQLRRFNAETCVKLAGSALDMFRRFGTFVSRPQRKKGRYYSFMPSCVKEICVKKFKNYCGSI